MAFITNIYDIRGGEYMPIALSKNGKCLFTIVTHAGASPSELHAARQLKEYLDRITSLDFPFGETGAEGPCIVVGGGALADKLAGPLNLGELGDEGFIIKAAQGGIVIVGGRLRGALYGVYEFLERVGCRFFSPLCENVPSICDLNAPELDVRQKPALEYREHWYRFYYD